MKLLATFFLAATLINTDVVAHSLYHLEDSPYATLIARRPGDLLTVIVDEKATTDDGASRSQSRKNDFTAALEQFFLPTFGIAKGFTKPEATTGDKPGISWNSESKFDASADNQSEHAFKTTFQVRIVEEVNKDHFVVRGHKTVNLNGKEKKIFVSGVIRQRDITTSNTINSSQIADALIEIEGEVAGRDVRPSIFNRILNFIF